MGIAEPEPLGAAPPLAIKRLRRRCCQHVTLFVDRFHLIQEPHVNAGGCVHDIEVHPATNALAHLKNAVGCSGLDRAQQLRVVIGREVLFCWVAVEAGPTDFQRAQCFLQTLRKRAPNGHRLTDTAHLGAEGVRCAGKLLERPTRHFGDHVIDRWFETGRSHFGDVVRNLIQGVTHRQLGGNLCNREPRRLGCQR